MTHFIKTTLAATLLAGPALAQEPICGGISLVGQWVGGTSETSDLAQVPAPVDADGQVPIAGHLVRMFTLSQETDMRIDVTAQPAGDPYISVYDVGGAEVASDDDSGGDLASRIVQTFPAGTYCLAARSYDSSLTDVKIQMGPAGLFSTPATPPAPTALTTTGRGAGCFEAGMPNLGNDLTAQDLAGGLSATLTAQEVPAIGFTLTDPSPVSIFANSVEGDPLIRLLDSNGAVLGENDDADNLNARIDVTRDLAPGAYCIEVEDLNGAGNPIDVRLQAFDPAAERLRRLNAAEFAPNPSDPVEVVDLGTIQTALLREVEVNANASWFSFEVPGGGLLLSEVVGDGLDPSIVLFDRVGRRIGENDDGPEGLDSFLATRLLPGQYLIAVRLIDASSSGTVRVLLEHYIPAP